MSDTSTPTTVTMTEKLSGHVRAVHHGCWVGTLHSTRTAEGHVLADRDADAHDRAHLNGTGWFDFTKGWVGVASDRQADADHLAALQAEDAAQWADVAAGEQSVRDDDAMNAANPQWFGDEPAADPEADLTPADRLARIRVEQQVPDGMEIACSWFALCDRAATVALPHPILSDVPACDRCAKVATS